MQASFQTIKGVKKKTVASLSLVTTFNMLTRRMGENHGVDSSPFDSLPEDCISKIVSFTSPRDACVAASVSKAFDSAVKSDLIWEKFLPTEYESLFPRYRDLSSKKELYFTLCDDPVLIDDGTKSFWLEKASGKKCIMLSAMSISIIWGDTPCYWEWIPIPEARTNTRVLSPRTRYSAYLVFKEEDHFRGFEDVPLEAEVGVVGKQASTSFICFHPRAGADGKFVKKGRRKWKIVKPEKREDRWMEIELGGFFNKGGLTNSDEVEMSALATNQRNWKSGLIIQGIEIRPATIR